jgi:hypothetical protein
MLRDGMHPLNRKGVNFSSDVKMGGSSGVL